MQAGHRAALVITGIAARFSKRYWMLEILGVAGNGSVELGTPKFPPTWRDPGEYVIGAIY